MTPAVQAFVLILLATGLLAVGLVVTRTVLRLRGKRLVTCPETREPAAVDLDLKYAVIGSAFGKPHLRLADCSRWPERQHCGQECLMQLEESPQGCLVRNIVGDWYRGKSCVHCGTAFGEIHWHDHRPALRSPEGVTVQWTEVRPETLPTVLARFGPVCWNCHVAESFRRQHPDLVIERPPRPHPPV